MRPNQHPSIRIALVIAGVCLGGAADGHGQSPAFTPASRPFATQDKPMPGVSAGTPAESGLHSMLDQPASTANVQVVGDRLTITATNASLTEVIRDVAAKTGMQVEGNSRDERVFGVYGPGEPPDVLTALLYDSGYNVLMVGNTEDGAPRRLVLSPRSAASSQSAAATQPARSNSDEDEGDTAEQPPMQAPPPSPPNNTVPPQAIPGRVKTPQQMLEELQRMRQTMQQQAQPQQ